MFQCREAVEVVSHSQACASRWFTQMLNCIHLPNLPRGVEEVYTPRATYNVEFLVVCQCLVDVGVATLCNDRGFVAIYPSSIHSSERLLAEKGPYKCFKVEQEKTSLIT